MPIGWSVDAYQYAFNKLPQIWRSYFNSIYITGIGTVLSTTMCAMYAYVLYRPDFRFRGFFNFLSFFTMIFGGGGADLHRQQAAAGSERELCGADRAAAGQPLQHHRDALLLQKLRSSGADRSGHH